MRLFMPLKNRTASRTISVNKGLRYIKESVYDVSLVTIAERLQIHPNYPSKIFSRSPRNLTDRVY